MGLFKNPLNICSLAFQIALLAGLLPGVAYPEEPLRQKDDGKTIVFSAGPRLIMRYNYGNVPFKPYVQELFSPGGVNILLDAPSDHLHHHALMFAVGVDGINFWEERVQPGRQQQRSMAETKPAKGNKKGAVGFLEQLDWTNTAGDQLVLKEQRKLETPLIDKTRATVLIWQSKLEVPEGKNSAKLTGEHYYGLGLRFIRAMDVQGPFFNAEGLTGEIFRGEERLTKTAWCAYTAEINGKPVTTAMFGHPDNLRSPTTWFTMIKPFAYLAATLNLVREPLELTSGKPLELRYCVAVWDGRIAKEQIEELYRWWLNWEK